MRKRILMFICGILASLPIVFPKIGFLQWVLLIPFALLCLSEGDSNGKKHFRQEYTCGFLFFFGYYLVCYSWFLSMYPLSVTGMPKIAALGIVLLAWVGIPLFQSLGFALIFPLIRYAFRRGLPKWLLPIFSGALWSIGEWVQNFFWFGLPWVKLALGQVDINELYRSANLFGSYFVTFLIVSVNFYLAVSFKETVKKRKCAMAVTSLIIFLANALYGIIDLHIASEKSYDTVRISAFQGNISTQEKWSSYMLDRSFEIYERLAEEASEAGADYAILPETVIPYVTEDFSDIDSSLRDIAWKNNITLMVGTFGKVGDGTGNIIRVYEPMREGVNVYTKQKPVPFGEYVPMRDLIMTVLPVLGEINMLDRSLIPGEDSTVWQSDDATFGYLICFDSIYDYAARKSVKNGADLLLISTNDSWFGDSAGTRMHSSQAKLRAVENGRSVVRAANTGISSIITPLGEIVALIPVGEEGQITADVPITNDLTLYTRIGNLFVYICIVFKVISFISIKFRNKITVRSS
ncbi:MAG: apolipoprotein N-acyltransferase [Clostridia bacterium]|nr:apolipoprotein N-acyltransferase [Clostridia bacterium]